MVAKPHTKVYSLSGSCVHLYRSKYFCLINLIQINNSRVFFKFRLLLWSLFNLQMYTHMYKFKPFPMYFIWHNSQLLCLVNKNVGTCTYVCACVYVCVQFFL